MNLRSTVRLKSREESLQHIGAVAAVTAGFLLVLYVLERVTGFSIQDMISFANLKRFCGDVFWPLAVTFVVIVFVAAELINALVTRRLQRLDFLQIVAEDIATIASGLGLLGTVLGLYAMLAGMKDPSRVLVAMAGAIGSTVVGLILALICTGMVMVMRMIRSQQSPAAQPAPDTEIKVHFVAEPDEMQRQEGSVAVPLPGDAHENASRGKWLYAAPRGEEHVCE